MLDYRIFAATWNVGGRAPPGSLSLDDWLRTSPPADIYVLGYAGRTHQLPSSPLFFSFLALYFVSSAVIDRRLIAIAGSKKSSR